MELSSVVVDGVVVATSKKNSGGAFAKMKLTANMTKALRKVLGVGGPDEQWPPAGEKAGKLFGSFDTVNIILTAKQPGLLDKISEADIKISLADSFTWKLEDPKDENNRTVLCTFWARTTDLEAAQLMVDYKFSIQSGESKGSLTYNKPGEGTAAAVNESQIPMLPEENRKAIEEMPEGEGNKAGRAKKAVN